MAIILGYSVFFGVLFISLAASNDPLDFRSIIFAIIKALLGGGLFWFAGYILGDIIFKGVLTDVEIDKANMLDGGLIQRINKKLEDSLPGGPDMPLIDAESGKTAQKIKSARHSSNDSLGV